MRTTAAVAPAFATRFLAPWLRAAPPPSQGRFPFDRLVRFYPFADINRAVEDQRAGRTIKAILEVDPAASSAAA